MKLPFFAFLHFPLFPSFIFKWTFFSLFFAKFTLILSAFLMAMLLLLVMWPCTMKICFLHYWKPTNLMTKRYLGGIDRLWGGMIPSIPQDPLLDLFISFQIFLGLFLSFLSIQIFSDLFWEMPYKNWSVIWLGLSLSMTWPDDRNRVPARMLLFPISLRARPGDC